MAASPNASDALEPGTFLCRGEELYIVHEITDQVVVREVGNRKGLSPDRIPDVGDDCILPVCDGHVVEGRTERRRHCSEGCLEWLRNYPADGSDCPSYNCDDGTVVIVDDEGTQFERECTSCEIHGIGGIAWREAWWPYSKEEIVEEMKAHTA